MNKSGIVSGRTDTPLSDEGQEQAVAAGRQLKDAAIDCIVTSPMGRAKHTAELIAQEIGFPKDQIVTSDFFNERDFGPLEGTAYTKSLPSEAEGMESLEQLFDRAKKGYTFLERLPHDNILVVSHGAIGRAMRHCIDPGIPIYPSKSFDNAEVVELL